MARRKALFRGVQNNLDVSGDSAFPVSGEPLIFQCGESSVSLHGGYEMPLRDGLLMAAGDKKRPGQQVMRAGIVGSQLSKFFRRRRCRVYPDARTSQ